MYQETQKKTWKLLLDPPPLGHRPKNMTVTENVDVMYSITLHQWLTVKLLPFSCKQIPTPKAIITTISACIIVSQLESLKTKTVDKFLHDKNIGGINERLLSPVALKLCIIGNYSSCSSKPFLMQWTHFTTFKCCPQTETSTYNKWSRLGWPQPHISKISPHTSLVLFHS